MYTFQDWLSMEATGRKALRAATWLVTDPAMERDLKALDHVLGELRHAAGQLGQSKAALGVSPDTDIKVHDDAVLARVGASLFKRPE